jgi:NADH-quinone oxidoreductase subunit N
MNASLLLTDTLNILPEIVVALVALAVLVWDFVCPRGEKDKLAQFSLVGLGLAAALCFPLLNEHKLIFSNLLVVDFFAVFYKLIFLATAGMVILISVDYLRVQQIERGEYYSLILFASLGMMIMAAGTNFLTIYLGLELTALCSYILCGFILQDARSNESALKYFVLGLFASAILIYGISLVYGVTGSLNLYKIQQVLAQQAGDFNLGLLAGVVLLIVGFGFKIAAVPFHMWVPDVYEGAPTPVTALMAVGPKVAGFAALLRVFPIAAYAMRLEWGFVFALLAVVTVTLGNIQALRQESVKRMLAYSGIAHVGYALIGVVAATVDRRIGLASVVLYFLVYFLANIGAFGITILLCKEQRMGDSYEDFKGLGTASPWAAMLMTIFMLSLLGIPPTGGFIGKVWVFAAAMKADYFWLAIIGVINAIISAYYYLRVLVMMYMYKPERELTLAVSPPLAAALSVMALLTVYMGVCPASFFEWAQASMASLL